MIQSSNLVLAQKHPLSRTQFLLQNPNAFKNVSPVFPHNIVLKLHTHTHTHKRNHWTAVLLLAIVECSVLLSTMIISPGAINIFYAFVNMLCVVLGLVLNQIGKLKKKCLKITICISLIKNLLLLLWIHVLWSHLNVADTDLPSINLRDENS